MSHLLLVEDDAQLTSLLQEQLTLAGHTVVHAPNLAAARTELADGIFDLVILDRGLPDGDGLELASGLAESAEADGRGPAILMLTARVDVDSRVEGLYAGAADYLTKPFSVQELLARIHVRLRERARPDNISLGPLKLDASSLSFSTGTGPVFLPENEFRILHLMAQYQGRLFTQEDLERTIYGPDIPDSNTIEVYIYNLRRKLAAAGVQNLIRTVRNRGYLILQED